MQTGQGLAGQWFEVKKFLWQPEQIGRQVVFLKVGNNPADTGKVGSLVRLQGGPAAGYDHITRTQAPGPADGGARIRGGLAK